MRYVGRRGRDPAELDNDFGSYVVFVSSLLTGSNLFLCERVPFTLTSFMCVCVQWGSSPGFVGWLAFSSCWVGSGDQ